MLPDPLKRISVILLMSAGVALTVMWACVLAYSLLELGEHGYLLVRDVTGSLLSSI